MAGLSFLIDTLDRTITRGPFGLVGGPSDLTEHLHEEFGWEGQVAVVARVYHGLSAADRERAGMVLGSTTRPFT